jgi:hypothetical protein
MADRLIGNRPLEARDIGNVALEKANLTQAVVIDKQPQAMQIFLEIVNPN